MMVNYRGTYLEYLVCTFCIERKSSEFNEIFPKPHSDTDQCLSDTDLQISAEFDVPS